MAAVMKIKLNWFEDVADVLEEEDGRLYEIGTVNLTTLGNGIIGCVYYHHIIPKLEPQDMDASIKNYQRIIKSHQRKLNKVMQKIRDINREYPEISTENLRTDGEYFIDLEIPIQFGAPIHPSDFYTPTILQKIIPYIQLLGGLHELELL